MLWWLAQNTIVAAVLAGLVACACSVARPRPAVRHALWLVVLMKLLAPPLISWPWSAWDLGGPIFSWLHPTCPSIAHDDPPDELAIPARIDAQIPQAETEIVLIPMDRNEEPSLATVELNPSNASIQNSHQENPGENAEQLPSIRDPASVSIFSLGTKLWLIGALVMGLWQALGISRFRRRLRKALPPPDWLTSEVAELAALLHIRIPKIAVLPGRASPMIWTWGTPLLVWPAELSKCLTETSQRCVLLHELAHLRRRDHWVSWLELVGACLYWWNPLFWFVSRQVRDNAELACDAWVVDRLPDARRAFAEALIEVAQILSTKEAPLPALGLSTGRRRDFERRLLMIMSAGVPCKLSIRGLVIVGLLALTALPGWSPGQQENDKEKPAAPVAVPPPAPSVAEVAPPAIVAVPYSAFAGFSGPVQNDSEGRLRVIEEQLQALLKEVRGMRKGGTRPPTPATSVRAPAATGIQYVPAPAPAITAVPPTASVDQVPFPPPMSRVDGAISLTRAIYDLPAAKAKALADLLQDSKGPVVEIKAEGDKVTVTTTPEAQQIVGQLIAMLQGKARTPRTHYQYQAVPVTTYEAVPATR